MLHLLYVTFALFCMINCQEIEVVSVVDSWGDSEPLLLVTAVAAPPAISVERSILSDNTIGGERDIQIIANSSPSNTIAFAHVGPDSFTFAAPAAMSGFAYIRYDGIDGSPDLDTNGLNEIDLTQNQGNQFLISMACDLGAIVTLNVYSGNDVSSFEFDVDRSLVIAEFIAPFADFEGNADFSRVGALEIVIPFDDALDITIEDFFITRPVEEVSTEEPSTLEPEPRNDCFEFVQPIDVEFIDYNLGCTRKPFQTVESSSASLLSASLLLFIIVLLL